MNTPNVIVVVPPQNKVFDVPVQSTMLVVPATDKTFAVPSRG